jgi:hypothetical protein
LYCISSRHDEIVMIKGFINSTLFGALLFGFFEFEKKVNFEKKIPKNDQVYETLNHDNFIMICKILY